MSENANPLTHSVYFELKDHSPEKCEQLVESCYRLLSPIDGWTSLHAGVRDAELVREVNDQTFHVGLVIIFENRPAHDAYQTHENHLKFIANNKENWASVRIFDATARG
jgi:heme-degrading monooxygenase HmoA